MLRCLQVLLCELYELSRFHLLYQMKSFVPLIRELRAFSTLKYLLDVNAQHLLFLLAYHCFPVMNRTASSWRIRMLSVCWKRRRDSLCAGQGVQNCLEEGISSPSECLFLVLLVMPSYLAEKQHAGKRYVVIQQARGFRII